MDEQKLQYVEANTALNNGRDEAQNVTPDDTQVATSDDTQVATSGDTQDFTPVASPSSAAESQGVDAAAMPAPAPQPQTTPKALKVKKKNNRWGKPKSNEKHSDKEFLYRLLSNGLTLLLAGLIIAGGFFLPSLIYPYIDSHYDRYVQLARPQESTNLDLIPREPVTLYPWNTYDESRIRSLSTDEFNKLSDSGTAEYLVSTLQIHGMHLAQSQNFYLNKILNDFRCLEPQVEGGARFFTLFSEDLDADSEADIRCAVDYDGKIVSMIILSDKWENVQLTEPISTANANSSELVDANAGQNGNGVGESNGAGAGAGADEGDGTPTDGEGNTDSEPPDSSGDETDAEGNPTGESAGTTENTSSESEGEGESEGLVADDQDDTTNGNASTPDVSTITPPNQSDKLIWSFSYAAAREAYLVNQQDVFSAFRQIDLSLEAKYGYPYNYLLPSQDEGVEELLNDPIYNAINPPVSYRTEDYQLSIYRLPSGVELILYIDPATLNCVGFNIQQYNPSVS